MGWDHYVWATSAARRSLTFSGRVSYILVEEIEERSTDQSYVLCHIRYVAHTLCGTNPKSTRKTANLLNIRMICALKNIMASLQ